MQRTRGGVFRALLLGAIGGAIAGAILGQTIDGHVEAAHLIIMGVIGVISSAIVHRVRARRARPAA
jgi:uncharacterized membrane protein YeaQ/YmgE (transglycosylase-associated protein family)